MIERLFLPNRALPFHPLIDLPSGGALNAAHDLNKGKYLTSPLIDQRSENDVNMIWHDDGDI